jgi:hypothetical protein
MTTIDEQIAAVRRAIGIMDDKAGIDNGNAWRCKLDTDALRAAFATLEQHTLALDALGEIRNIAFYHMVRNVDQRGDRKVLGQIKELAITTIRTFDDAGEKPR